MASKTYAFFANGFKSFDNQIWREVDICPFFNMAVPAYLQALFEIEFNSSGFISKMETVRLWCGQEWAGMDQGWAGWAGMDQEWVFALKGATAFLYLV